MNQYRQGDVFLETIEALPAGARARRDNGVLTYGEVTGHSHAVADPSAAEVYEIDGHLFLSVTAEGGVSIVHQEHSEIAVPKGDYSVTIQREYTPEEIRSVLD